MSYEDKSRWFYLKRIDFIFELKCIMSKNSIFQATRKKAEGRQPGGCLKKQQFGDVK